MTKLVLASASPRRKEILQQAGFTFDIIPSKADEVIKGESVEEIVENLALIKASDVADNIKEPVYVIGSDTIVVYEGQILGKPKSREDAVRMLSVLQGNTHMVYTGVAFIDKFNSRKLQFHACTAVTINSMTEEEIAAYVDTKDCMDKAGSYGIQGRFAVHIRKIDGDYLNVVGFPLSAFYEQLKEKGYLQEVFQNEGTSI